MNFLGMGPMELMVILVLALIVVGPGKLPEMAGQVGRVIRDFRRTTSELSSEFSRTLSLEVEERKAAQGPSQQGYVEPRRRLRDSVRCQRACTQRPQPMTVDAPRRDGGPPKPPAASSSTSSARKARTTTPISRRRTESTATRSPPGHDGCGRSRRLFTALRGGCTIPFASPDRGG